MSTIVNDDLDDQFLWSQIVTTTDDEGQIVSRTVLFDDGTSRAEDYTNGVLSSATSYDVQDDQNGVHNWTQMAQEYDGFGNLAERFVELDDGVVILDTYQSGILVGTEKRDESADGTARAWESIAVEYDESGALVDSFTLFDDATVLWKTYENGVISSTLQFDESFTGDAKPWSSIQSYFDENGVIEERVIVNDNEILRVDEFENGVISTSLQIDESRGNSAQNWSEIRTNYDENGVISDRGLNYDDGMLRVETFEDGVLDTRLWIDESETGDAKRWSEISMSFDDNGDRETRFTTYDDGTTREDNFEDGVRATSIQRDESDGGDAVSWSQIFTSYDESGRVSDRVVNNDNGIERHDRYDDGQLERSIKIDNSEGGEARTWDSIATHYDDNGDVEFVDMIDDNYDQFLFAYSEGELEHKIERDGNESEDWQFRVSTYEGGEIPVSVEIYYSFGDLPEEIQANFEVI